MEFLVLDTNFVALSVLDNFKSAIWTDRYNAYGDFEIYIPASKEIISLLKPDYYLWTSQSEHVMIVESAYTQADSEDGDYLLVKGRSLESILDRRIVWDQTNLKGNLQNGIKQLLTEAYINPKDPNRKVSNFKFVESSDESITKLTMDAQYTGDLLYDVIKDLCERNDIGFKIILNDNNDFVFSLYAGKDRTYNQSSNPYVVFSPSYDNVISSDKKNSNENLKNVTLVAGEGEGTDRKTATVGSASGLSRRELFTDARDISSTVEDGTLTDEQYKELLVTRGKKDLAEYKVIDEFECEADVNGVFAYGIDYEIGDVVQMEDAYGGSGTSRITEFIMSQDDSGFTAYPTFDMVEKGDELR